MSAGEDYLRMGDRSAVRNAHLQAVIDDCRCRRLAGEVVSDDALIAAHPGLMPELGEELRKLRLIAATLQQGAQPIAPEVATRSHHNSDTGSGSGHLEVRCPNCHQPTEIAVDTALTDLTCSTCGSHFSLVDQSNATHMAPSLSKLGRFELIERLGVGGFGSVWKARDKELDRTVAIKIPRAGALTATEQEQFFREARAAAQLRHPSIVSVHEVGRDGDSVYIVSDFVRGVTLGDWLTGQQLTSREAAELCAKIADALHHAHQLGVVHRDLKPANIMIDGDGQPHLMDFGLARREVGEVTVTLDGQVLGTPAYMSPEQAQGEAHTADRRSDVYSLGVILFQLVTGELPFRGNARMLMHQVIHDEPPSPRKLNSHVAKDLETIALKCLEKDPAKRFQSTKDLADELGRYLAGDPIQARPIGRLERSWRWMKRNPSVAMLTASVAALLVTVAALSMVGFANAKRQQLAAEESVARETKLREVAEENRALAERARAESTFEQANALHLAARGQESRNAYMRAQADYKRLGLSKLPTDVALFRSYQAFAAPINKLAGHTKGLMAVSFAPDNIHAFTASEDATIFYWDIRVGCKVRTFIGHDGSANVLSVSRDGTRLVSGGDDGKVLVWDVSTAKVIHRLDAKQRVRGVAFSPDSKQILSSAWDHNLRLWDAATGGELRSMRVPGNYGLGTVVFSPDSKLAAVGDYDGTTRVFDLKTGAETVQLRGHSDWVVAVLFSPDSKQILSASYDRTARIWDLATSQAVQTFAGHLEPIRGIAYTTDGRQVLTGSLDGTVRLWDAQSGKQMAMYCGHQDGIRGISLSPDGRRVLSAGMDNIACMWNVDSTEVPTVELGLRERLSPGVNVSPDGRTLLSANSTKVTLYDCAMLQPLRNYVLDSPASFVAFLPDNASFITSNPTVVRDLRSGKILRSYPDRDPCRIASNGRVALSIEKNRATAWDPVTGKTIGQHPLEDDALNESDFNDFKFSPDARHALSAHRSGNVCYWDLASGRRVFSIAAHGKGQVNVVAFSPDGSQALSGGQDLAVRLWELPAGTLIREFKGSTSNIFAAGFSLDGRAVYAADQTRMLRAWNRETGELLPLNGAHSSMIVDMASVPNSESLFTFTTSSALLWDFSRPARYIDFEKRLTSISRTLTDHSNDASALRTLAEWYDFRGVHDWAAEFFDDARAAGAKVSSLELARLYWQVDRRDDAIREFRQAIEHKEAPTDYLELCLGAVNSTSSPSEAESQ